jgi:multidrug efflux system membrane fusion protein
MTSSAAGCTGERELKRIQKAKEDPTIEPQPVETPKQVVDARPRSHRRRALGFLLALALVLAGWWGSGYVFAYTDDAYVASDIVSITPEVSGPIATVDVADNQFVARGTPLFTIDPIPFELEVQQARAREAEAQAQLPVDQAQLGNLRAQQAAAEAAAKLAATNLGRHTALVGSGAVSQQAFDTSRSTAEQATAEVRAAEAAVLKANQTLQLHQTAIASAHAARLLAEWRLSRTRVVAPVDGHVTHLTVQSGDMVSPSHAAVAIVDAHAWRVIANYKEYDLRHLHPGQEAWVWLDTRPWHLYRARIQGVARGFGREQGDEGLVPYVSPTVDWIRLQRRVPVRLVLLDARVKDDLIMGADARTLVIY